MSAPVPALAFLSVFVIFGAVLAILARVHRLRTARIAARLPVGEYDDDVTRDDDDEVTREYVVVVVTHYECGSIDARTLEHLVDRVEEALYERFGLSDF